MPEYPTSAVIKLFGAGQPDEQYLERWRSAPLTYQRGQAVDDSWHTDHYEYPLGDGKQSVDVLFARAADLILRYEFYPPSLMAHVSDFAREGRRMRAGDRIVQRIRGGLPFIEGLTMNEVVEVMDEPARAGFTYVASVAHSEMGEWSALVEKQPDSLKLTVHAISSTRPEFPAFLRGYARQVQKRAHDSGIRHFTQRVLKG
ncbi:MAG: DUF1990 family protein [Anaerolineae bacterium]